MTRLLLTGGRQRQKVNLGPMREWRLFDQARLLELDTDTGEIQVRLEYVSPPEHRPEQEDAVVFKAGCVDGDRVGLVTQTEVLVLDRENFAVSAVVSHPWFNDLHHVCWLEGRLHVVSTGLDRLLTVPEVAEYLGVSESTVRKLAKSGRLPSVPLPMPSGGSKLRFSVRGLESYTREATQPPTPRLTLADREARRERAQAELAEKIATGRRTG